MQQAASNVGLPKWPMCLITGPSISEEQAKQILFNTDAFFHNLSDNPHTNGSPKAAKFYDIIREECGGTLDCFSPKNPFSWWWQDSLVNTAYLRNDFVNSSFVGGPHGWCHPSGSIFHADNIGKWPSVEDVEYDLNVLLRAYPFLKMNVTLFSGENCEPDIFPLISFKVGDGKVQTLLLTAEEHLSLHADTTFPRVGKGGLTWLFGNRDFGVGVTDEFVKEFASTKLRSALAMYEAQAKAESDAYKSALSVSGMVSDLLKRKEGE